MSGLSDGEFAVYPSVRRARQCLARTEGVKGECMGENIIVAPSGKGYVDYSTNRLLMPIDMIKRAAVYVCTAVWRVHVISFELFIIKIQKFLKESSQPLCSTSFWEQQ